jgi:hypothetical protein
VRRPVQVRTDSAGCTGFVWHARSRHVGFAVIARSNAGIHAAISRIAFDGDAWQPALGEERPGRPWPRSPGTSTFPTRRRDPADRAP